MNTLRKLGYGADGESAARAVERAVKREREHKAKEESAQKAAAAAAAVAGKRFQQEPVKEEPNKRMRKGAGQPGKESPEPNAIESAKNKVQLETIFHLRFPKETR